MESKVTKNEVTWSIYTGGQDSDMYLLRGTYNNITFSSDIAKEPVVSGQPVKLISTGLQWCRYKITRWWVEKKILWAINMLHWVHIHEWPYYLPYPCEKCSRNRVEKHRNGDVVCENCNWDPHQKEYRPEGWQFEQKPNEPL